MSFADFIKTTRETPNLTLEEEQDLIKRAQAGDDKCRDRLVLSHLKLAMKLASGFRKYQHDFDELMSVAITGLLDAVGKYKLGTKGDDNRAARFSTYASYHVKAALHSFVLANHGPARLGTTSQSKRAFFNLTKVARELGIHDLSRLSQEQVAALAERLDISEQVVQEMAGRMARFAPSLDAPVKDAGGQPYRDLLLDDAPSVEETLGEKQEAAAQLAIAKERMKDLSERELEILHARILCEKPETFRTLGQRLGISWQRVAQIESAVLWKLRGRAGPNPLARQNARERKAAKAAKAALPMAA